MKKLFLLIFSLFLLTSLLCPLAGLADKFQVEFGGLSGAGVKTGGQVETPAEVAGRLANGLLAVAGAFALLMMVYGGIMILSSAGNQEKIGRGKTIIIWSIIGFMFMLSSYVFASYIIASLGPGTTQGQPAGPSTCVAYWSAQNPPVPAFCGSLDCATIKTNLGLTYNLTLDNSHPCSNPPVAGENCCRQEAP